MSDRKISIIMTYYNRKSQLLMTLTTLKNQTYKNFEVVIYDDNSDDEHSLDDIVNNYDFNIILLKRGNEPKKYTASRGYNLAAQKASGDILVIQNPECCYVQNDLLEYVNNNANDKNYLVFSCFNITTKLVTDRLKNVIDENRLNNELRFFVSINRKKGWYQHSVYKPVGYHFTCAIIKKNYEKMGGFDERYCDGIDYDDNEFIQRIKLFLNVQMIDNYNVLHLYHDKARYAFNQNYLENLRSINATKYNMLLNEIKNGRTDPSQVEHYTDPSQATNKKNTPKSFYPISTGGHESVILDILHKTDCHNYLELGIYKCDVINNACKFVTNCVGVDVVDHTNTKKDFVFYKMTTDEFFSINNEKFDIIFIDADHKYESCVKDFENSLNRLNYNGIIFIHDTDPISLKYTTGGYCGDSYKINKYIYERYPELDLITLPLTEAGLSIVKRKNENRYNLYTENDEQLISQCSCSNLEKIKLSVLVASVPSRLSFFYPRLMKQLIDQTKERNDVEILGFFDNKKRSVGQKRQGLLDLSNGEYVVFIDDDDRITDNYIEKIMNTLYENDNVDCVVFNTICKVDDGLPKLCKYGIEFEYGDINQGREWRGKPAHTMVYKSDIAKKHKYIDMKNGEDFDWVKRAWPDIKTQIRIDEVLYFYDANYSTTSETASLSDAVIEKNINKLLHSTN